MLGLRTEINRLKRVRADVVATIRFLESPVGQELFDHPDCPTQDFYKATAAFDVETLRQIAKSVLRDRLDLWTVGELRRYASNQGIPNASAYPKEFLIHVIKKQRDRQQNKDQKDIG